MDETERRRAIAEGLCRLRAAAPPQAIPSGSVSLDWALGAGGFPRGRLVEVYGSEACGKTTIALSVAAQAQRAGGTAAFIDADHALDPAYAGAIGVDLERLLMAAPGCGEEALEIAARLAASRAVDLVIIDSVAALVPRMEVEGGPGDACPGLQHHLIEHALRKLAAAATRTACAVLLVNQIRSRSAVAAGDPETTAGGYSLRMHAAIRAEVRSMEADAGGIRVRVRMVKNRLAPLREAIFGIRFGAGIARDEDLAACAARCGIRADQRALANAEERAEIERAVRFVLRISLPE